MRCRRARPRAARSLVDRRPRAPVAARGERLRCIVRVLPITTFSARPNTMRDRSANPLSTSRRLARAWSTVAAVAAAALCATLAGCGSHGSTAAAPASLRLVNATQASTLTLSLNGAAEIPNLAPGAASGYASIAAGSYTSSVGPTDGSLGASTQLVALGSGGAYTTLAYQRSNAIVSTTFTDNLAAPAAGGALVRVANVSQDAGPLDVYIVAQGSTSLTNLTPTFQNVPSGSASTPSLATAGTYGLFVTAYANQSDVRFSLPAFTLSSTEILTIALTSTSGGALVNATLITQGGATQFIPNQAARVRLVAAFPPNGTTSVTANAAVNSTTLPTLTAPSLSNYSLVTAPTTSYAVVVNGVSVATAALPATSFASGGDYTILAYGSSTAPTVAVFTDNNQTAGFDAIVRVINASVPTGGVSLSYNFQTLANNVAYGAASAYTGVTPSSAAQLQLTSPNTAFVTYTVPNVNFVSSAVYTLFALGAPGAQQVNILNRDR